VRRILCCRELPPGLLIERKDPRVSDDVRVPKPPQTATLAEMYVRQGLIGRAREIFRALSKGPDPVAAKLAARRLLELGPTAQDRIELLQALLARVREQRR
jgi:lipopolysaccharide biosynthesis regulator YciM